MSEELGRPHSQEKEGEERRRQGSDVQLTTIMRALALRDRHKVNQVLDAYQSGPSRSSSPSSTLLRDNPKLTEDCVALLETHCRPGYTEYLRENVQALARKHPHRLLPVLYTLSDVVEEQDLRALLDQHMPSRPQQRHTTHGRLGHEYPGKRGDYFTETKQAEEEYAGGKSTEEREDEITEQRQAPHDSERQMNRRRKKRLHEREGLIVGGVHDYLQSVANIAGIEDTNGESNTDTRLGTSNSLLRYGSKIMLKGGKASSRYLMVGSTDEWQASKVTQGEETPLTTDALLDRLRNQDDLFTSDLSPMKGYRQGYFKHREGSGDTIATSTGNGEGRKRDVFVLFNPLKTSDTCPVALGDKILLQCQKTGKYVAPIEGTLKASVSVPSEEDALEVVSPLSIAIERALSKEIGATRHSTNSQVPAVLMAALGPRKFALGIHSHNEAPPLLVQLCERVLLRTSDGQFLVDDGYHIVVDSLSDAELESIDSAFSTFLSLEWDMIVKSMLKFVQPVATVWLLQLWNSIWSNDQALTRSFAELGKSSWFFTFPHSGFTAEWNILRSSLIGVPPLSYTLTDAGRSMKQREVTSKQEKSQIEGYPLPLQEAILVEDCLDALVGATGRHIEVSFGNSRVAEEKRPDRQSYPLHRLSDARVDVAHDDYLLLGEHPIENAQLVLASDCDPALASLVERILPIANQYILLRLFVERKSFPEAGLVGQALASAVNLVLREYTLLVSQLEHMSRVAYGDAGANSLPLSLQQMWFHLQKASRTLSTLQNILTTGSDVIDKETRGGALLNVLYKAYRTAGDDASRDMIFFLLERASKPFLQMLQKWIFFGIIDDPTNEFMVKENEGLQEEEFEKDFHANSWNSRYYIVTVNVPEFLQTLQEPILTTGKYLNALRYSGLPEYEVTVPHATVIPFSPDERDYTVVIQQAYEWASHRLLQYVMRDKDLIGRLHSMKAYFFMSFGDYIENFMDAAEEELGKPIDSTTPEASQAPYSRSAMSRRSASVQRLRSLLELAIRTSVTAMDPYKDEITCRLESDSLVDQVEAINETTHDGGQRSSQSIKLKAFNCLTLDYIIDWPLNIVLSRGALVKYQLLFRHLFYCKHVERRLCRAWTAHQECKELNLRGALSRSYLARQRMLHFMQNLIYYMTFEVIEPQWHEMNRLIRSPEKTSTVDDVIRHHENFLDNCLEQCLLTNKELFTLLHKIATLCMLLSEQMAAAIDSNKLTEDEVDQRAGITPEVKNAMNRRRRARKQRHEEGFGRGEKPGAETPRGNSETKSQGGEADSWTLSDTQIRIRRVEAQTEAMRHSIAQENWQKMVQESNDLFDNLLKKFLSKLFKLGQRSFNNVSMNCLHF
eukprot:gb/GECG01014996.1/.p1 GENE.gb/GECG01014996.1/~~gb/GECG01014996.1/.p1  ORF type:complete len:1355 (+),score=181.62 gb/GECG01014996.1/:1-4065(+)